MTGGDVLPCAGPVELGALLQVLAALLDRGARRGVGGEWAVDALAGHQTRRRRNVDLAIDARAEAAAIAARRAPGYQVQTDWTAGAGRVLPAGWRLGRLHPVIFDGSGHGHQHDLDGGWFDYPPGSPTAGHLDGRSTPRLSLDQQIRFHTGYLPRDIDRHDLAFLHHLQTR
jgi:lincosamide nucleotidyltransferase A/C/D/E